MSTIINPSPVQESRRGELMTRLFLELQIARFNELYYQRRSRWMRRWAVGANIVAAISASAVLASLLKDGFGYGPALWQVLTGIAALSAAIGPTLGWETQASQLEKAALGHSILRERIRRLLNDLKLSSLDASHEARDEEIDAVRLALTPLDEPPHERLKEKCWRQTLREFPSEQAWTLV
jgi:hypothetical protein